MKVNRRQIRVLYILILTCSIPMIFSIGNIGNNDFNDKGNNVYDLDSRMKLSSNPPDQDYFNYYKEITINHLKVAEDLTNFPLLISIIDSDLHSKVQSDGDDIAFSNGTDWLDYEIELFDHSYSGTEARLVAWIRIPLLSSTVDTKIYMYYGNSTMPARQNSTGVWTSNYKAVWHLNTTLLDSTSNNNDGTNSGADDVSALIGNGRDYNGAATNGDYSNMGSGASIDNVFNGGATISAWIYPEGWGGGNYGRVLAKSSVTDGTDGWVLCVDGVSPATQQLIFYRGIHKSSPPQADTRGLWYTGDYTVNPNQWNYVVITYDDSVCDNYPIIYINDNMWDQTNLTTDPAPPDTGYAQDESSQSAYIGNYGGALKDRTFDGVIDEVRISSGIKSFGWIKTEFNNQKDPNSFYTVGTEISIDTVPPDITINSPNQYDLFGQVPPNFNVEINESGNIDSRWYRLFNGTVTTLNTTFTTNGTINQARWDEMGNGTVAIQFFANDSSGNIGFSEVTVRKDIRYPTIVINSPNSFELFGTTPPTFNVETSDDNGVDDMWYTLNNGIETYFTTNGSISSSVWSTCGNGTVSIKFYANDSLGNEGFSEVIVRKEVNSPTIQINSPNAYECFGKNAPSFNVLIRDNYTIDDMWYTLKNGIETYFTTNGTISQSIWNTCGNGTVSIKFYANNSLGNGDFSEVIVRKDIINPTITINSPDDYDLYGQSAPAYNVLINDPNGIESKWYTLDGGTTNTTFISNGIINQTRWNEMGSGIIVIRFYARDTLGNMGFSDVSVDKDIDKPNITINFPAPNQLFGAIAPSFNIKISDHSSINLRTYSINNGINVTFATNASINQALWNLEGNGTVNIKFYAKDSLGNEGFSEVNVRKDIDPPTILINNPLSDQVFGTTSPTYNVEITDINGIDTMWYSLDGGLTNTIFTTNGSINQTIWDSIGDGSVSIRFYSNNSMGTIGYSEVSVIKDVYAPRITITIDNPINEVYCNEAPIINVYASDVNLDKLWCEIGNDTISLINNDDFELNSSIWNSLPQGFFQIFVYANDTLGHLNNSLILDFCKDTIAPNAPTLTEFPSGEVSIPLIFDWQEVIDDSGIKEYRIIIDTEQNPDATPGFTFEEIIQNNGSGSCHYELLEYLVPRNYYFFIYQIDMAGNQGNAAYGTFTIKGASGPESGFPWWIIPAIAAPLGLALLIVGLKKSKKKNIQILVIDKELDKLKEKRTSLDTEAKGALKAYNYVKAAEIYEECAQISYNLYNEGDKLEQSRYKHFKDLEMEARSKAEAIPIRNACINKILTKFFDENGIKYYSDPQIYPENQDTINGLILNENNFIKNRFTELDDGMDLAEELHTDLNILENVNAIQILYAVDLSADTLIDFCQKYQNPEMILYIVGVEWPAYNYDERINLPKDSKIKYSQNISVISVNMFARIFLLTEQNQEDLQRIIKLSDLDRLKELYESMKIDIHDTEELKDELKQKGWFFLI